MLIRRETEEWRWIWTEVYLERNKGNENGPNVDFQEKIHQKKVTILCRIVLYNDIQIIINIVNPLTEPSRVTRYAVLNHHTVILTCQNFIIVFFSSYLLI